MFEEKNSLCLTVETPNKIMYLLRIADYIHGELVPFSDVQVDPSNNVIESIYTVPTISVAPREAKVGELCIWRWQPRENEPNKQNSYKTTVPFWCLIISPETSFKVWDKNDVIKVLRSGFTIPINLPDSFLLKLWEGKDTFRVIHLLKKDLIILENKARLPDSTDTIKCFKISKNDFFTVDDRRIINLLQKIRQAQFFINSPNYRKPLKFYLQKRLRKNWHCFLILMRNFIMRHEKSAMLLKNCCLILLEVRIILMIFLQN